MKTYAAAATDTMPAASLSWDYDANGNIRHSTASYVTLDRNGVASAPVATDYWFRFDAMNRLVTDRGVLSNGQIMRGVTPYGQETAGSQDIQYDAAGQRVAILRSTQYNSYGYTFTIETRESYGYDAGGRLVSIGESADQGAVTRRSSFGYDLLGHQVQQSDYDAGGGNVVYSRSATYRNDGQVRTEYISTRKTDGVPYVSDIRYDYRSDYGEGPGDVPGQAIGVFSRNLRDGNDANTPDTYTSNAFTWWDGAVQSSITHRPRTDQSTLYTSTFNRDALGTLQSVQVEDGRRRTVTFVNDIDGQVIRRTEQDNRNQGNPSERWYRFNGRELGYTGNNGTDDLTENNAIADRQVISPNTPGAFRNGQLSGTSYTDFAQSSMPLNSFQQGSQAGSYTVRGGDTLQGIARNLWGDAGLWYKLAEANGLSASSALPEGTVLTLPAGVMRSTHNANTLTPYDPSEAIGDVSPTTPQPNKPKKNKCGTFGVILLAVVAVAVTVVTAGAALAAIAPTVGSVASGISTILGTAVLGGVVVGGVGAGALIAAGVAGAVAGSIASQGLGVATGIQDKFSWKAVAIAGIGAAVSGGLAAQFGGGGILGAAARGAAGSAITQGVSVATGLQRKFDWAGVAAAGIGAGAGQAAFGTLPGLSGAGNTIGNYAAHLGQRAVSAIANAATRSAIDGSSFGDGIKAALPDIIAQTLGDLLFNGVSAPKKQVEATPISCTTGGGNRYLVQPEDEYGNQIDEDGNPLIAERTIVVTGKRMTEQEKKEYDRTHSLGYRIADAFGAHKGGFLYGLFHGGNQRTSEVGMNIATSVVRAPFKVAEATNGFGHGVYDVGAGTVRGIYKVFTTNPVTTAQETMYGLARGIDRVLIAEDTPAIVHLDRLGSALGNASAYDLGYGFGQVSGNLALFAAPELAGASRLKFVGGAGNAGVEAAGRWGTAAERGIEYGALDALGRPTGVQAIITKDMIGTGTAANPSIIPPGWSGNGTLFNEARGHLLGRQLGGSGDLAENLVTLQQNPANSPFMRGFESQVRSAAEGGQTVRYSSTPIYNGANLVPRGVTLSGKGASGFDLNVTILNPPGR